VEIEVDGLLLLLTDLDLDLAVLMVPDMLA
jgi:hypothetical protein